MNTVKKKVLILIALLLFIGGVFVIWKMFTPKTNVEAIKGKWVCLGPAELPSGFTRDRISVDFYGFILDFDDSGKDVTMSYIIHGGDPEPEVCSLLSDSKEKSLLVLGCPKKEVPIQIVDADTLIIDNIYRDYDDKIQKLLFVRKSSPYLSLDGLLQHFSKIFTAVS